MVIVAKSTTLAATSRRTPHLAQSVEYRLAKGTEMLQALVIDGEALYRAIVAFVSRLACRLEVWRSPRVCAVEEVAEEWCAAPS